MSWLFPTEREKWRKPLDGIGQSQYVGLRSLDARSQLLYGRALPRGVPVARAEPERPAMNMWMAPHELIRHAYVPGQLMIGKLGDHLLGHMDDRPIVTIAGARAGKTSTVLEPNLYLYSGSMLVLDPKGELSRTAALRRALGHDVYVLDPFKQSSVQSACFNALNELDPASWTIVDDASAITHALIVDDGDARSKHWNDSARWLLLGLILLALTLPKQDRNLITVRQLLSLTYPMLVEAMKINARSSDSGKLDQPYFAKNGEGVETLLRGMVARGDRFDGVLASIGNRFLSTPPNERGSIFSTAATQTDFLDSLPLRRISRRSDFPLSALRSSRPTTIYLCLPVGRMESHYRWLRLVIQLACTVLERMGTYPRDRAPILFMLEEFAVLGTMPLLEKAAAYFPGFGVKLWTILQDIGQLQRNYSRSWETFIGNAGLIQTFANGDETTLRYISERLAKLIAPFEIRTAFSRTRASQLLMMEGEPPAAALRLQHEDVDRIRDHLMNRSGAGIRR